jgi:hypothetical protein
VQQFFKLVFNKNCFYATDTNFWRMPMDKKCVEKILESRGYPAQFTHSKEASFGGSKATVTKIKADGKFVRRDIVNEEMIDLWKSIVDIYEGKKVNCYIANYMQVKNILFCNKRDSATAHSEDFMLAQMKVFNNIYTYAEEFVKLRADTDIILESAPELKECKIIDLHHEL